MFYWLYDIPVLAVVALFAVVFVGLCWLGTILVSPKLVPWFQGKANLNEILGDYLQYFGVIYGLLLGLLAVPPTKTTLTLRRQSQARHHRSQLSIATSALTPSPIVRS